jgi:hypothetical protein
MGWVGAIQIPNFIYFIKQLRSTDVGGTLNTICTSMSTTSTNIAGLFSAFREIFDMYAGDDNKISRAGIKLLFRYMGEIVTDENVKQWLQEEDKNGEFCL